MNQINKYFLHSIPENLTCSLNFILSRWDFLAKFDKKDNEKTEAALPTITKPSNIELTPTDVPGLKISLMMFKL